MRCMFSLQISKIPENCSFSKKAKWKVNQNTINNIELHYYNFSLLLSTFYSFWMMNWPHAFIPSKLDYCNWLGLGLQKKFTKKTQLANDSKANLLNVMNQGNYIMPVLHNLDWLPIHYWIQCKARVPIYEALMRQSCAISRIVSFSRTHQGHYSHLAHVE